MPRPTRTAGGCVRTGAAFACAVDRRGWSPDEPEGMLNIDNVGYCHLSYGQRAPMNVSLTPELEKFVSAKVQSGRYNSASEVVREALRLLEEHDSARAAQLAEFNREIGRRLASLDRGEAVDPVTARARLQRKSEQRKPRA